MKKGKITYEKARSQFTPDEEKMLQKMIADIKEMRKEVKSLIERIDRIRILDQPITT